MMLQALGWILRGRLELAQTIEHVKRIGWDSGVIILVTGTFSGMVLAFQTSTTFLRFGAQGYVGGLVGISLAREAAPIFTAITLAGRVGAGIAAEIGTMTVTEQVDALRVLATNPVRFLVVPRLLAAAMAMPALTVLADVVGGIGGYLVATGAGIHSGTFWGSMRQFLYAYDVYVGLIKAAVFGIIIAGVGCYRGLQTSGGADGVGRAATGAVVTAIVMVLVSNYFLNLIFFRTS
jgi:phospholipid/cholesterol/gamma-HCH transport system permease protein